MPTYDYQCAECGKMFEVFQSITAKPKRRISTDCEQCEGKAPVRRLIGTGGGIIFKGSGFYGTDYRSDNYKKAAKAESESSSGEKSEKKDSSKKDSPSVEKKADPAPAAKTADKSGQASS